MPRVLTPAGVREQIDAGQTDAIYLLQGDDDVEKAVVAHDFEALVEEGLRAFNVELVNTSDVASGDKLCAAVSSLLIAVRTLPMMVPRRVVIVPQAEALLVPKRESDAAMRALDELEALFEDPPAYTTLVLVANAIDRRSRMYKQLLKHATLVECGVLESVADAERWVRGRMTAATMRLDVEGTRLLAERCGTNLKRLRNDVERLLLYALGQKTISVDDVREIVGPAALQDDWAMTNAIEVGDAGVALRQLALLLDAGAPPEKILGQLGWVARTKFPIPGPGGVRSGVGAVFRTDLDLKRSAGDPRVLLERLVVELCGGNRRAVATGPTRPTGR